MTTAAVLPIINYVLDDVAGVRSFAIPFPASHDEIRVYLDGEVMPADQYALAPAGGDPERLELDASVVLDGQTLSIHRLSAQERNTDFRDNVSWSSAQLNADLDRMIRILQDTWAQHARRSVKVRPDALDDLVLPEVAPGVLEAYRTDEGQIALRWTSDVSVGGGGDDDGGDADLSALQAAIDAAQSTANTAQADASTALTTANAAQAQASTALTTANGAIQNAGNAVSTANDALDRVMQLATMVGAQGADIVTVAAVADLPTDNVSIDDIAFVSDTNAIYRATAASPNAVWTLFDTFDLPGLGVVIRNRNGAAGIGADRQEHERLLIVFNSAARVAGGVTADGLYYAHAGAWVSLINTDSNRFAEALRGGFQDLFEAHHIAAEGRTDLRVLPDADTGVPLVATDTGIEPQELFIHHIYVGFSQTHIDTNPATAQLQTVLGQLKRWDVHDDESVDSHNSLNPNTRQSVATIRFNIGFTGEGSFYIVSTRPLNITGYEGFNSAGAGIFNIQTFTLEYLGRVFFEKVELFIWRSEASDLTVAASNNNRLSLSYYDQVGIGQNAATGLQALVEAHTATANIAAVQAELANINGMFSGQGAPVNVAGSSVGDFYSQLDAPPPGGNVIALWQRAVNVGGSETWTQLGGYGTGSGSTTSSVNFGAEEVHEELAGATALNASAEFLAVQPTLNAGVVLSDYDYLYFRITPSSNTIFTDTSRIRVIDFLALPESNIAVGATVIADGGIAFTHGRASSTGSLNGVVHRGPGNTIIVGFAGGASSRGEYSIMSVRGVRQRPLPVQMQTEGWVLLDAPQAHRIVPTITDPFGVGVTAANLPDPIYTLTQEEVEMLDDNGSFIFEIADFVPQNNNINTANAYNLNWVPYFVESPPIRFIRVIETETELLDPGAAARVADPEGFRIPGTLIGPVEGGDPVPDKAISVVRFQDGLVLSSTQQRRFTVLRIFYKPPPNISITVNQGAGTAAATAQSPTSFSLNETQRLVDPFTVAHQTYYQFRAFDVTGLGDNFILHVQYAFDPGAGGTGVIGWTVGAARFDAPIPNEIDTVTAQSGIVFEERVTPAQTQVATADDPDRGIVSGRRYFIPHVRGTSQPETTFTGVTINVQGLSLEPDQLRSGEKRSIRAFPVPASPASAPTLFFAEGRVYLIDNISVMYFNLGVSETNPTETWVAIPGFALRDVLTGASKVKIEGAADVKVAGEGTLYITTERTTRRAYYRFGEGPGAPTNIDSNDTLAVNFVGPTPRQISGIEFVSTTAGNPNQHLTFIVEEVGSV